MQRYGFRESPCLQKLVRSGARVICISSFPAGTANITSHTILTKDSTLPLVVFEDEQNLPAPGVTCNIELNAVVPWLENITHHPKSPLNTFLAFAGAYEPIAKRLSMKGNHLLFRKILSIIYTLEMVPDGPVIIWLDSDVTREARLTENVISWLSSRDLSYIPFYHRRSQTSQTRNAAWMQTLEQDWRLETGVLATRSGPLSRLFFERILELYLGDLESLARICAQREDDDCKCSSPAVKGNVYMNDIYVMSLLVHASLMKNLCVLKYSQLTELSHGWFGVHWKCPNNDKLEGRVFSLYPHPNFCPPNGTNALVMKFKEAPHANIEVANFNILRYFMHLMGTNGGLRSRLRGGQVDPWLEIPEEYFNYSSSLMRALGDEDEGNTTVGSPGVIQQAHMAATSQDTNTTA